VLFNLYSKHLTSEAIARFGDFKIGQEIRTVQQADELMLLVEEKTVLQGMTDRLKMEDAMDWK
jgi:hypothetical protein